MGLVFRLIAHHAVPLVSAAWIRQQLRIPLGWGAIGDVRQYMSPQHISRAIAAQYPELPNAGEGGACLWSLCHELEPPALVIIAAAKRRRFVVQVTGPYMWLPEPLREPMGAYQHQRDVRLRPDLDPEVLWTRAGGAAAPGYNLRWALVRLRG